MFFFFFYACSQHLYFFQSIKQNPISYPGLWDECLNIAAVGKSENLPTANFSNTNPEVDYAGIGVDAISFKPDGGYQNMSGT